MREKLAAIKGQRARFRAKFDGFHERTKRGFVIKSVILVNVTDAITGAEVCDHVWMRRGKQFDGLGLQIGDRVEFEARVEGYWKGYGGPEEQRYDYGLKFPTLVRKLATPNQTLAAMEQLPLFAMA